MTANSTGGALPENRWDLLDGIHPVSPPMVTVVVAHFRQQGELDRTLAALARQTHPADRLQVIVVDDGSPETPRVPSGVLLLEQDDLGFRLSAARNLGVASATGEVLCFLDADTAPEPEYITALTRLPALSPDVVTVGVRRHADFAGAPIDSPVEVFGPAHELTRPAWLADAYASSSNLLTADDRSYRFMIGAVLCCSRALLEEAGGFDETFTEYGGEDWEWAHRAWSYGALFAHVPEAIAWHDGPDWADRDTDADATERRRRKNGETLALADRIPVAGSRPRALVTAVSDVVVRVSAADSLAALMVSVDSLLLAVPHAAVLVPEAFALPLRHDSRVSGHSSGGPRLARARLRVDLEGPVLFEADDLRSALDRVTREGLGSLDLVSVGSGERVGRIISQRAERRASRWGRDDLFRHESDIVRADVVVDEPGLAGYFGGW